VSELAVAATALAAFIVGALWRRMYGGWLGFNRSGLLSIAVIMFGMPAWFAWHSPETCWRPILIQVAIALQFCLGVEFDDFLLCAVRYTVGPFLLWFAVNDWQPNMALLLVFLTGPAVAVVYYFGKRSTDAGHPWAITWPWDTPNQQMTTGYTTFGELAAGGFSALAFVLTPMMRTT
jgi:hypothetical protein